MVAQQKVDEMQTLRVNSYDCKQSAGALPSVVVSWRCLSTPEAIRLRFGQDRYTAAHSSAHSEFHAALSNWHVVC